MITKSIIKAAEKATPFEQKARALFAKRAPRLIAFGIISVASALIYWEIPKFDYYFRDIMPVLGFIVLVYLSITAAACFFASINKFTMTKFIIANIAVTAIHFLGTYISAIRFIDLSINNAYWKLAIACFENQGVFIYIPAIILSLLTGLLITRTKKPNEA